MKKPKPKKIKTKYGTMVVTPYAPPASKPKKPLDSGRVAHQQVDRPSGACVDSEKACPCQRRAAMHL